MAITGNSGCGQSTAASFAAPFSRGVCSLDSVGHRLLRRGYVLKELEAELDIPDPSGMDHMDLRRMLAGMVFDDAGRMRSLNGILHPRMVEWARRSASRVAREGGIWVLEGALVFELGLQDLFDRVITVKDTMERSAERLSRRDGISAELAALRWRNQLPIGEKAAGSDIVVENSCDLDYLKDRIVSIFTGFGKWPKS